MSVAFTAPDRAPMFHVSLILEALRARPAVMFWVAALAQGVFDAMFLDMDTNLREMGVGDLAVPKRMQRFGEAFYGRRAAYGAALAAADTQELEKALARNIFEVVGVDERAARLARYARAAASQLDAEEDGALMAGTVTFPNPEALAHA